MNKNDIISMMKKFYKNNRITFPKDIAIEAKESGEKVKCIISLDSKHIREENMQKNYNAFEGWSIVVCAALRTEYKDVSVILDLKNNPNEKIGEVCAHWNRFLYRAKRFTEQYKWFSLSDTLKRELEKNKFIKKIEEGEIPYTNNIPKGDPGEKSGRDLESKMEEHLANETNLKDIINGENISDNKIIFGDENVYRQLPVGLFEGDVKGKNKVFPSRKAAIDLWSWRDDNFYVVELKASNPMIGIITEIFFYSNYMRDLLITKKFKLNEKPYKYKEDRGYGNIVDNKERFKQIEGIMLADKYHPTLEEKTVLELMNENGDNTPICYHKVNY